MTRTLYLYISRDLAKATVMSLIPLSLVMIVLMVAEPLREKGLSGDQVLSLFGYTAPVVLSLTLPVAALLAGTLVYGRFSQNNEFLAAKASGVSAMLLLRPALVLGLVVTVLSLVLSNYVTPSLTRRGQQSARDNIEGLVFQQLRTKNYVRKGKSQQYVHATRINAAQRQLQGVVALDISDPDSVSLLIAPRARIRFDTIEGERYATFALTDAVAVRTDSYDIYRVGDTVLESLELPQMEKEDPSWYDLDEMVEQLSDPTRNPQIRTKLINIQRSGCSEELAKRVIDAINHGESYSLSDGVHDYVISAGWAETVRSGQVRLLSRDATQGVAVRVFRNGVLRKTVLAESGKLKSAWSQWSETMKVSLELGGLISVRVGADDSGELRQRGAWGVGDMIMPQDIAAKLKGSSLLDVYQNPHAYTSDTAQISGLAYRVGRVRSKIKAEMHGRVAYSLSCCLMVAMGAALGLMFRGGQVLSAFGIAIVPALFVIVMIFMGKGMVSNHKVHPAAGLAAIWGGLVLLMVGNAWIYTRLARR